MQNLTRTRKWEKYSTLCVRVGGGGRGGREEEREREGGGERRSERETDRQTDRQGETEETKNKSYMTPPKRGNGPAQQGAGEHRDLNPH